MGCQPTPAVLQSGRLLWRFGASRGPPPTVLHFAGRPGRIGAKWGFGAPGWVVWAVGWRHACRRFAPAASRAGPSGIFCWGGGGWNNHIARKRRTLPVFLRKVVAVAIATATTSLKSAAARWRFGAMWSFGPPCSSFSGTARVCERVSPAGHGWPAEWARTGPAPPKPPETNLNGQAVWTGPPGPEWQAVYRRPPPPKICSMNRNTLKMSRKIPAAIGTALAPPCCLRRRRLKSKIVNPPKITRPRTA